eukprot:scaffold268177_cov21-Tisochrysis_lutea.AAC.2
MPLCTHLASQLGWRGQIYGETIPLLPTLCPPCTSLKLAWPDTGDRSHFCPLCAHLAPHPLCIHFAEFTHPVSTLQPHPTSYPPGTPLGLIWPDTGDTSPVPAATHTASAEQGKEMTGSCQAAEALCPQYALAIQR